MPLEAVGEATAARRSLNGIEGEQLKAELEGSLCGSLLKWKGTAGGGEVSVDANEHEDPVVDVIRYRDESMMTSAARQGKH